MSFDSLVSHSIGTKSYRYSHSCIVSTCVSLHLLPTFSLPSVFIIGARGWRYANRQIKSMKIRRKAAAASGRNNESKYGQWKTTGTKERKSGHCELQRIAWKSTVDIQFAQTWRNE